jgi:hypothetical protein
MSPLFVPPLPSLIINFDRFIFLDMINLFLYIFIQKID